MVIGRSQSAGTSDAAIRSALARLQLCCRFSRVSESVIKVDPEIMSGAPCFSGTRVPIQNLIDYLEGGDSIGEFLEDFPTVTREQVISFLEEAKQSVLARAV
jgi:uncharacterized protein (DUF433 family)